MDSVESTLSLWKSETPERRTPLRNHAECDVCVVGAGMAGLSVAYQVSREGKRVIVLDAHDIGAGETAQTSAHLASALDDRFFELERVHGRDLARMAYESHAQAIDEIEAAIQRESIQSSFRRVDGYLFLGPGQTPKLLDDELAAARRAGFAGAARIARAPLSFDSGPCLQFPNQARFHPLRYLSGIATAIERAGGALHGRSRVVEVRGGDVPRVRTHDGFEVRAAAVIVATNSPFHLRLATHLKQAPYRTYVIVVRIPTGTTPDALYWDACDPYHYVRIEADSVDSDYLIVGGEDHRVAESNDADTRYGRLEQWTRARFPVVGDVIHRWSGQVLEPFDHLAFIGKDPTGERNVYIATGDSGHGLTHGAIAGVLLADLVAGRNHPWEKLYDPARVSIRAAGQYVRGGLAVAKDYAQWLMPERRRGKRHLPLGEGKVVQRGPHKIAVYCDFSGAVHERSAVCTHLGGVVRWNSDARSWDCGCHGSRFAPTGEVLNGPAMADLAPVKSRAAGRSRLRSMAAGAIGGGVATLAMTAALVAPKKLGQLGEFPPKKIVRRLRRRAGVLIAPRSADNWMTAAAHLGFGVTVGAFFGFLHRRRHGVAKSSLLGTGYGVAIWMASYWGWVPALGMMPAPHRDRPGRATSMLAAHLLYGGVLGAFVDAAGGHSSGSVEDKEAVIPRSEAPRVPRSKRAEPAYPTR